jgi:hypothetical protein
MPSTLTVFEWKKKKSVVFAVRVRDSERMLFRMYYSKAGDLYLSPLIHSKGGATVTLSEARVVTREQMESGIQFGEDDLDAHGYVSFHVSGVVKGPDFKQRSDPYESGHHSITELTEVVEVCEQRSADPGAYPEVSDTDRAKKNIIFIPSAPAEGMYPVIHIDFIPNISLAALPTSDDYLVGLLAEDVPEAMRFVAFIRVAYVQGDIPAHHQITFKRRQSVK